MSVHAALVRPVLQTSRGRHAKPRPAWPRVAGRAVFLVLAVLAVVAVVGAGWPPVLLVVPAAALVLFVASVTKLRTASRKIDTIFAEELIKPESVSAAEAA
jgi:fatty acid desaturase